MPTPIQLLKASAVTAIQTALAATVAGSASSASASAIAAAASAAQAALIAAGLVYKGVVAGNAVANTSTAAGDFFIVTSAGTSQSKTWAALDLAIYKGTSGQWDQVVYASVTSSYVDPLFATRAAAPHFFCDGASSGRAALVTLGSRGKIAGAPAACYLVPIDVPAANAGFINIFWVGPNNTNGGSNRLGAFISAGGALEIQQVTTTNTHMRSRVYNGFRAAYGGRRVWLKFDLTQGTASPTIKADGVDITSLFVDNNLGTPPPWLDAAMVCTFLGMAGDWVAGVAPIGFLINGAISDGESELWRLTGRPPAWTVAGGSQVNLSVVANSIRSGAADTNTTAVTANTFNVTGSVEAGARTGGAGAYFARGTTVGGGTPVMGLDIGAVYPVSRNFEVSFWARSSTAQTILVRLKQANTGTSGQAGVPITTSWAEYSIILPNLGAGGVIISNQLDITFGNNTAAVTVDIDDVEIRQVGALSLLRPQVIPFSDDWTLMGGNGARLVGIHGITDDKWWRVVADVDMSTTGNKQLFGGALFNYPDKQAIDSIEHKLTGTPTFSIGDGTTATRYTASSAPGAGRSRAAIASPFPADAAKTGLFANVTATGGSAERITITGHMTD